MSDNGITGGEPCEYEACEVPLKVIEKMKKNGTWEGSLEEEEVLYNLKHDLYSDEYTEAVQKILY